MRSFGSFRSFPLALVALVAFAGCSGSEPDSSTSGSGPSTTAPSDSKSATKGTPQDTQSEPDDTTPTGPTLQTSCAPGADGSLYALSVKKLGGGSDIPMCAYQGSVVLIVNGASGCGYTPQYKPLEALYAKYHDTQAKKFEVIAFPSDSFNQEKDTDKEVSEFCTSEYHITFPLTTIGPVVDDTSKGVNAQPVYQWIYKQPGFAAPVSWNFEKFLVGKDGEVIKRWLSATSPDEGGEIDKAIEAELAK